MTDPALVRLAERVLLPGFSGAQVPDWLARAADRGLAGVCVFAPNVPATGALADRGLLVASDEEGGSVTRLDHATGSPFPSAAALGRLDDIAVTEAVGAGIGARARAAGVGLVLAPVADVNAPDNPVIGVRAFGDEPALVARHTAAFVRGVQAAGAAACAKHWPGHGSTTVDSHVGLPTVADDLATLQERDLPPFAAAVEAGVAAVLTAHVRFPALDGQPATMSPAVLDLLRRELGFTGVIVSDALDMHAIARGVGRGPGGVAALAAGVDLLCTGNPAFPDPYDDEAGYREVRDAVLAALVDGTLDRRRVEEAGDRVAELPVGRAGADPGAVTVGAAVARRVLDVVGDVRVGGGPHVLDLTSGAGMAAGPGRNWLAATLGARADGHGLVVVAERPSPELAAMRARRPDAVVVVPGVPDPRWSPEPPVVRLWGSGRVHAEAAARCLTSKEEV
ncbi:glycoside hydrolase family 3 N-terminal domain-containing protein [Pseudonocardia sp. CA-107938]|uniref:glycoside hydrolase family 3 N-terminal domain-containing protein n=1 Tax=Pseudonocardia sp. CA-107938 TaxID=3240021 RepID=UPI003D8DFC8D